MTGISDYVEPIRRPGALGVHSLDHVGVSVPDLKDVHRFYGEFGLDTREAGNGINLATQGGDHVWGNFVEGPRKKLRYLSFGAYEEDFERLRANLSTLGVPEVDPPAGLETNGVWVRDHDGNAVEIKVSEKVSPNRQGPFGESLAEPGTRGAPLRSETERVKPRRLSHALLFTSDVGKSIDFYASVLGLRFSDRSADLVAFLHGAHGSDHHMLAFVESNGSGLHHLSWDMASVNEVGIGASHMAEQGYAKGWGLGRHVLGSNFYHYVMDPWGSFSEYAAGIDYIPADCDWQSDDFDAADSFYLWGPDVPEAFTINHETAS